MTRYPPRSFQGDRGLLVASDSQASRLDSSTRDGIGAKMGLDAAKALGAPEMKFKRIRVTGEDTVDLAKRSTMPRWRDGRRS